MTSRLRAPLVFLALLAGACSAELTDGDTDAPDQPDLGGGGPASSPRPSGPSGAGGSSSGGAAGSSGTSATPGTPPPAPGFEPAAMPLPPPLAERLEDVQEGDIYRIEGARLYILNTFRGLLIYDIENPKTPKLLSRVPTFGVPIEMYVQGTTVLALVRENLMLTQTGGAPQFVRTGKSLLFQIEVAKADAPFLRVPVEFPGQLKEGASRKVGDVIYVVSEETGPNGTMARVALQTVAVAQGANPRLVDKLDLFAGPELEIIRSQWNTLRQVSFGAMGNTFTVVGNWLSATRPTRCGEDTFVQVSTIQMVDISDRTGRLRNRVQFSTPGWLLDQFKHSFTFEAGKDQGSYLGIFARQVWPAGNCQGRTEFRNVIESWSINAGSARRVQSLPFGKPAEAVVGSYFDRERGVAFAVTATGQGSPYDTGIVIQPVRTDPFYAISISDPAAMRVLSAIDGLSGDMGLFRPIRGGQYLIAVGRDNSSACAGAESTRTVPTRAAVSIIDVRNPAEARLVQRQCVSISSPAGVSSGTFENLDQAHKMIGLHEDELDSLITVPVHYRGRTGATESAIGLMSWDLGAFDQDRRPEDQNVIQNIGSIIHPAGKVLRTVIFRHPVAERRRTLLNISDDAFTLWDLQAPRTPSLLSSSTL